MTAGGIDWVTVQSRLARWVLAGSGLTSDKVLWSQNKAPRPAADGIVMRLTNIGFVGDPWTDVDPNPFTFDDLTVTAVDAAANTFTITAHGLRTGDGPVQLTTTGTLPAPLQVATDYWVIRVDNNTIKLSETFAGTGGADVSGSPSGNPVTPIDLTSAGTGTTTVQDTDNTLRAGEEILQVARGVTTATLELECHTSASVGLDMAVAILHRVAARSVLPSQVDLLEEADIGVVDILKVRAVRGHLDAILFEPRAMLDIHIAINSEESETDTIIWSTDVQPTVDDVQGVEERFPVDGAPS